MLMTSVCIHTSDLVDKHVLRVRTNDTTSDGNVVVLECLLLVSA